jgi:hypothetical protein
MAMESKWSDSHYVRTYRLRRDGMDSKANLAIALGVSAKTLARWFEANPALAEAWEIGGADRGATGGGRFREYVFQRLPSRLQAKWQELEALHADPCATRRIEEMFAEGGEKMRQHLFVHALCVGNWNPSKACKFVGISKARLDGWIERDPDFAALIDEVHWHKKNWLVGALDDLVIRGEPAAVIFANRTQNADRGYGKTSEVNVNVNGQVQHNHLTFDMDKLNLPIDIKLALLEAVREQQKQAGITGLPGTVTPARVVPHVEEEAA